MTDENQEALMRTPSREMQPSRTPKYEDLQLRLAESSRLVEDIVLKNYLAQLDQLEIIPLLDDVNYLNNIRLFRITEMVYQKDEYSTYKFASVFNSIQHLNCGVFVIADSDGAKTSFYMGVRSFDSKRTTSSLKNTLQNALSGQFPGAKTEDLMKEDTESLLESFSFEAVASVSCVAQNKDEEFKTNESFLQGLEKLALAMEGKRYTAIILAKSTPSDQLEAIRQSYETIYTNLSPFSSMQVSYGTNTALTVSDALSHGITHGTTHTDGSSEQKGGSRTQGTSRSESISTSDSVSSPDMKAKAAKVVGSAVLATLSIATAPLTGGASRQ